MKIDKNKLLKWKYTRFYKECIKDFKNNKKYFNKEDIKMIKLVDKLISKILSNELKAIQKEYEESAKK